MLDFIREIWEETIDFITESVSWVWEQIKAVFALEWNPIGAIVAGLGTAGIYFMFNANPLYVDSIFFSGWRLWFLYAAVPVSFYMTATYMLKK